MIAPKKTNIPITNVSLEKLLKEGLLPKNDQITAMVVKKTKTKTRCINQRSNFQTLIFLLDNCLKGSPAARLKLTTHPRTIPAFTVKIS